MKKSFSILKGGAFSKLGFLPFLLAFLFVAAMQVDIKAQSTTLPGPSQSTPAARSMYKEPSGPFVTPAVAQERLLEAMKTLKTTLSQQAEGTGPYEATLRRFNYFNEIYSNLQAGKGVAESIVAGLGAINNSLQGGVTPEEAMVEKNAAINLLRP